MQMVLVHEEYDKQQLYSIKAYATQNYPPTDNIVFFMCVN